MSNYSDRVNVSVACNCTCSLAIDRRENVHELIHLLLYEIVLHLM